MSALGQKQTLEHDWIMFAIPLKADMDQHSPDIPLRVNPNQMNLIAAEVRVLPACWRRAARARHAPPNARSDSLQPDQAAPQVLIFVWTRIEPCQSA